MDKVLYFHSGLIKGKKKAPFRATAAGVVVDGRLRVGIAKCSPQDQFVKKNGRALAVGRALNDPYTILDIPAKEEMTISKLFQRAAVEYFESLGKVTWFRTKPVITPA